MKSNNIGACGTRVVHYAGHENGELWTLDKICDIYHKVKNGMLESTLQNIKGCTEMPLIEAVPEEHFFLSVLHILIGTGNILVEFLLEQG
jgi:hypothetical protein